MPHIDIKSYPKHLSTEQFSNFISELTKLAEKHLHAQESDISIRYTEIPPEEWKAKVYDTEIRPNLAILAKKPGYTV